MTAQGWLAWDLPPPRLRLCHRDVHVHAASLDAAGSEPSALYAILSSEEHARASRYRFAEDRARFVAARGLLRIILSCYLGVQPGELALYDDPHGKPQLDVQSQTGRLAGAAQPVQFNVSHCQNLALYAVALGRRVGIDIERIRPGFAEETLVEHFFSPAEVAALRALPATDQRAAFFSCWTRKEAYLKARGEGLVVPMDSFTVSLAPGEPAALLEVKADPRETELWSMCDLPVAAGYAAALVVEGRGWRLRCWRW